MLLTDLETIIGKCKRNDRQAQAALYQHIAPKLLGICLRYFSDRAEAEDIMQDSLVKIFMNIHTYRFEGSFEGWCKRLTVNTALNRIKVNKRLLFDRNQKEVDLTEIEEQDVTQLTQDDIVDCLKQLPNGYRTIVNLFLFENYSHREIAEQLDINESTSRSQYTRARQQLAQLLKEKLKTKETRFA